MTRVRQIALRPQARLAPRTTLSRIGGALPYALLLRAMPMLLLASSGSVTQAQTAKAKNVALIIANSRYDDTVWPHLANTVNDAKLIHEKMVAAKFQIDEPAAVNLTAEQLRARLREFAARIDKLPPETIVWIYYAGHGMQIDGTNYLIPLGAPDPRGLIEHMGEAEEQKLARNYISLNELLQAFGAHSRQAVNNANILILDACRDNPFHTRSATRYPRGLAETPQTANTLIAYSAAPGATADDGPPNGNSPYALAFSDALATGYLPLELVFNSVTSDVIKRTSNRQRPDYRVGLAGYFCIVRCSFSIGSAAGAAEASPTAATQGDRGLHQEGCTRCIAETAIQTQSHKSLMVSQTVVPLGLWKQCIEDLACPSRISRDAETDHSVATGMSYSEILGFIIWLNNATGKVYRLPTSEEWSEIHRLGHSEHGTRAAAMEMPIQTDSAILVDEGISEWTSSCDSAGAIPDCSYRLVRGSSWEDTNETDTTRIDAFAIDSRGKALGFRVVRDQ